MKAYRVVRLPRLFSALWFFCVLTGGALLTTQVAAQAQYGAVCDGCTLQQYTECAVQTGGGIITECRMEGGNLRCFPRPGSD